MQNRPLLPVRRQFSPISLPDEFPVTILGLHSPSPAPVDWLHQHDCLELGYCHQGAGVFIVEDKVLPFGPGDVSVINDREMHRARSSATAVSSWSFILVDPAKLLATAGAREREVARISRLGGPRFGNIFKGAEHRRVAELVRGVVAEMRDAAPGYRAVVKGHVLALMALLHRGAAGDGSEEPGAGRESAERVAPALDYIARNYGKPITVPQLAEMCFASESAFRRRFKAATGRAPQEYVAYLRIQMATALLESTGAAVLEIAQRVGYRTLSSFNRHFRRISGCSPRQWRQRSSSAAGGG